MHRKWSPSQEFVFVRSYARWNDELGRRETWGETVDRYFQFFEERFRQKVPKKVFAKCRENVLSMDVMPSMRALWAAGPCLEKNHITAYNCSGLAFRDLRSVTELFYILMCGAGVGFSVEQEYIAEMPKVPVNDGVRLGTHTVADSREGWADALDAGLQAWFDGHDIDFDFSQIRPKGARLVTMGGRASGPEPLRKMLQQVRDIILHAQGRALNSLEWTDIGNFVAEAVSVGGIRRSSEIAFSDLEDDLMRHAKDKPFPPNRFMSNNTAVYREKPDIITFMEEWTALAKSGSGERGIFNLQAANKSSPRRAPSDDHRTNPCQPAWVNLLTPSGLKNLGQIQVGDTIWSGQRWTKVINKIHRGPKEVYVYNTTAGSFTGTRNHRVLENGIKTEIQNANYIDIGAGPGTIDCPELNIKDIMDGLVMGDGTVHKASDNLVLLVVGKKDQDWFESEIQDLFVCHRPGIKEGHWEIETTIRWQELPKTYERVIPYRFTHGNSGKVCGFLRGLYSANGSVVGKRITLKASSFNVIRQVQIMLSSVGIASYYTTNPPKTIEFSNGEYTCKESYDLNISTDRNKFKDLIGFIQKYKQEKLNQICRTPVKEGKKSYKIRSVENRGVCDVFDITVEAAEHTYWVDGLVVSNCGEIIGNVSTGFFCNLTEIILRPGDTMPKLIEKAKSALWMGVMQGCLTNFPYIRNSFKRQALKERLLGISLSGQMDCFDYLTPARMRDLKDVILEECKKASKALDINFSAAITCVKPSGTVSELVNCSAGAHPRYDRYYIRRYRIASTDPLFRMMRDQGVKFYPENGQGPESVVEKRERLLQLGRTKKETELLVPEWDEESVSTWVCEFPIAAPPKAITRHEIDAIQQLEHYLTLKRNWVEHNVSLSVYVKKDEWLKVGAWVYDHFDDIVGVSFFPFEEEENVYNLAPFEPITKEQYEEMVKKFPTIDYTKLSQYETEDQTEGAKELACAGGKCAMN